MIFNFINHIIYGMYNKLFIFMFVLHIVLFIYRGSKSKTYAEQEEVLQEAEYYFGNIST
jgi:hypothetical protein